MKGYNPDDEYVPDDEEGLENTAAPDPASKWGFEIRDPELWDTMLDLTRPTLGEYLHPTGWVKYGERVNNFYMDHQKVIGEDRSGEFNRIMDRRARRVSLVNIAEIAAGVVAASLGLAYCISPIVVR